MVSAKTCPTGDTTNELRLVAIAEAVSFPETEDISSLVAFSFPRWDKSLPLWVTKMLSASSFLGHGWKQDGQQEKGEET